MMMGRKFEEDDWAQVYTEAKNIPHQGWSNLNIDIMYQGLGVEHKMLRVASNISLNTYCGQRIMHPALTRSIRVLPSNTDPQEAMRDVFQQYAALVEQRRNRVRQECPSCEPDMRTGWLLWQESLEEFLYFEEEMLPPDPNDYRAEWHETRSKGTRKKSTNLWIFEGETGHKRYSVTTEAGAKIQPYFDVPPPNDPNLYIFRVQGEPVADGLVRLWITASTHRELIHLLGKITTEQVSGLILRIAQQGAIETQEQVVKHDLAVAITVTSEAYSALKTVFEGVSDEHLVQLLVKYLRSKEQNLS